MCNDSILRKQRGDVRWHAARLLVAVGSALVVSVPTAALAQSDLVTSMPKAALAQIDLVSVPKAPFPQSQTVCGAEVKEEVAKALASVEGAPDSEKLALEKELYAKYQFCAEDAQLVPSSFYVAARECGAGVSNLGSLFFEEMSCSGYDPQRRQFASPIKIKQTFGFGGAPLPGSREHVLHCVADASGTLVPVGHDSVHLADAIGNQNPTWQFAVIVNANQNLHTVYPMNGETRRARSILSWAFTPTDCNFTPIWGNALNYHIRLDQ